MRLARISVLAGSLLALGAGCGLAESLILKESFNDLDPEVAGVVVGEGASWREFRKTETAPQISDQEFFSDSGEASGKSVRLTRADAVTMDFWLIGAWETTLESGRARVSFRILRDNSESGMSVHFGDAQKAIGVNTIGVSIGNRIGGEKLMVMNSDGAWQDAGANPTVGTWAQIALEIDFTAMTYTVLLDGVPAAEAVPFKMTGPMQRISFLPAAPVGNVSYIDDVEVTALD
jgi:hypothetical protein